MLFEWNRVLLDWINSILLINLKNVSELRSGRIFADLINYLTNENCSLQDFLLKNYPCFKRGADVASLENPGDEVLVASLLLHYSCINVKDSSIKVSMCQNISCSSQKAIKHFVDFLMHYENVTEDNLLSALNEFANNSHFKESNSKICTPKGTSLTNNPSPMLDKLLQYPIVTPTTQKSRKIFRLEAELEAERYDRNFLQDDVNRKHRRILELENLQKSHVIEIQRLREKLAENEEAKNKFNIMETCNQCTTKEKVLREQFRSQELEILRLVSNSIAIEEERDSLRDKTKNLEKDLKKWQIHAVEIERNLSLTSSQAEQYQLEIISLKSALTDTSQCLNEYRQQHSMNASVECDDDIVSKGIFNVSLNSSAENLGRAFVDIQLKEQLNNSNLAMENSILKEKIQKYQEEINYLEKQATNVHITSDEINVRNESLEFITIKKTVIDELEKNISDLKSEILILKDENKKYQEEFCYQSNQIQTLTLKLNQANLKINTVNNKSLIDYDYLLQEKIKLCSDLEQKELEISQLKSKEAKHSKQIQNSHKNNVAWMKHKIMGVLPSISIITIYHLMWYFYLDFQYNFSYSKC